MITLSVSVFSRQLNGDISGGFVSDNHSQPHITHVLTHSSNN